MRRTTPARELRTRPPARELRMRRTTPARELRTRPPARELLLVVTDGGGGIGSPARERGYRAAGEGAPNAAAGRGSHAGADRGWIVRGR
jgi:hypothetical protein